MLCESFPPFDITIPTGVSTASFGYTLQTRSSGVLISYVSCDVCASSRLSFMCLCLEQLTLNEVATGFSFSVSTILANRLMISIRKLYYTKIEGSALHSIPSRDHSNFEVATTGSHYEGYELQTFQERRARSECSGHAIYLYELNFAREGRG